MRHIAGALIITSTLTGGGLVVWRLVRGIEWWFATSGAADALMWSLVTALILTVFALPVAMWGIAARCWLVRIEAQQHVESTAHILAGEPRHRIVGDVARSNDQTLDRIGHDRV